MRWERLFADMQYQFAALGYAEQTAETAESIRSARSLMRWEDRLRAGIGTQFTVNLGSQTCTGICIALGREWISLRDAHRQMLILGHAVHWLSPVPGHSKPSTSSAESLPLGWALRALSRSRMTVHLHTIAGETMTGTIDEVGADHLVISLHMAGEARRNHAVTGQRLLPTQSLQLISSKPW